METVGGGPSLTMDFDALLSSVVTYPNAPVVSLLWPQIHKMIIFVQSFSSQEHFWVTWIICNANMGKLVRPFARDEIAYPFLIFNGCIGNCIPRFTMHVITLHDGIEINPCNKRNPRCQLKSFRSRIRWIWFRVKLPVVHHVIGVKVIDRTQMCLHGEYSALVCQGHANI